MAVRCAEFDLPAAIGCGDQIYQRVVTASSVELNCAEKILRPLHANYGLRIGVTMRCCRHETTIEPRDALAQDWAHFISVRLPECGMATDTQCRG